MVEVPEKDIPLFGGPMDGARVGREHLKKGALRGEVVPSLWRPEGETQGVLYWSWNRTKLVPDRVVEYRLAPGGDRLVFEGYVTQK